MNRTRKISRMYHQLRPEIDHTRKHSKWYKQYRYLLTQKSKTRLMEIARKLQIQRRSTLTQSELVEACAIKGAVITVRTGKTLPWT